MKYLGIDYGSKRVGLANTADSGEMAFPKSVIKNSPHLAEEILKICEEEKIDAIVIGESKDYKGEPNKIMDSVNEFIAEFSKISKIPIHFHPEFMTSIQAGRIQGENDMLDASAAAIILQSYLDLNKNNRESATQINSTQ